MVKKKKYLLGFTAFSGHTGLGRMLIILKGILAVILAFCMC